MDISAGEQIESKIFEIAKEKAIIILDLKTQKRGSTITANIKISLASNLNLEQTTQISNSLKENLIQIIESLEYVAIQIESHNITDSYYKPHDLFGKISKKGTRWQKKGQDKNTIKEARGKGQEGYCICAICGYKIKHETKIPCSKVKCPKCKTNLKRK